MFGSMCIHSRCMVELVLACGMQPMHVYRMQQNKLRSGLYVALGR